MTTPLGKNEATAQLIIDFISSENQLYNPFECRIKIKEALDAKDMEIDNMHLALEKMGDKYFDEQKKLESLLAEKDKLCSCDYSQSAGVTVRAGRCPKCGYIFVGSYVQGLQDKIQELEKQLELSNELAKHRGFFLNSASKKLSELQSLCSIQQTALKRIGKYVNDYLSNEEFVPLSERSNELLNLQGIDVEIEKVLSATPSSLLKHQEAVKRVVEEAIKLRGRRFLSKEEIQPMEDALSNLKGCD